MYYSNSKSETNLPYHVKKGKASKDKHQYTKPNMKIKPTKRGVFLPIQRNCFLDNPITNCPFSFFYAPPRDRK